MSKYKCETHKLDLICRGCMKAWIARHEKMAEFIRKINDNFNLSTTDEDSLKFLAEIEYEAYILLDEIGELK